MKDDAPIPKAEQHAGRQRARPVALALHAATRIRSKLIFLHTLFSLALAVVLLVAVRYPVQDLVRQEERRQCDLALRLWQESQASDALEGTDIEVHMDDAARALAGPTLLARAVLSPGVPASGLSPDGQPVAVVVIDGRPISAVSNSIAARAAVDRLYLLLTLALLAVYGVIALSLEAFVLPKQVYLPIERLRHADAAVQRGDRGAEIIPDDQIPGDELGEIMRSRNSSIRKLREQERRLEILLAQVEEAAAELKRKNHLLETARRNLADQDRLASLGMMSAGIAHELNTPLAVLKGSVEQLIESDGRGVDPARAHLMLRVVQRLERLGESLLDFARVREPASERVNMRAVVEEAWTLARLDREAGGVEFRDTIEPTFEVLGDEDRLVQVFVNLIRNAVDAAGPDGRITVTGSRSLDHGDDWVSISIRDNGPGISPEMMPRLFEPFASTRLDSRGTGLGLAVAEGIVKEHGGVILARNASPDERGAEFEVMLPAADGAVSSRPGDAGR